MEASNFSFYFIEVKLAYAWSRAGTHGGYWNGFFLAILEVPLVPPLSGLSPPFVSRVAILTFYEGWAV